MYRYYAAPWLHAGLRLSRAIRQPPNVFRILLFHDIPSSVIPKFETLIDYIVQEHGVITPQQANEWLSGSLSMVDYSPNWRAPCLLSFDDGFLSNHRVATQVLGRYGIKGLFFVAPGLTELSGEEQRVAIAQNIFGGDIDVEELDPSQRLMSWDELSELKNMGHEIGCHGMSHRRLSELDENDAYEEIVAAGELLNMRLDQQTIWYAYAFGGIESITSAAIKTIASRYRYCRSGLRGANDFSTPNMALKTDSLDPEAPLAYQKLLLEGGLDFYYSRKNDELAEWADLTKAIV
jgi:peptidoglycan/xylan/chitin deacetylase (PgdA/CDA1 family)